MTEPCPDADPLSESEEYNDNDYVVPYEYSTYVTAVADVPGVVTQWAGIGKISSDIPNSVAPPISKIHEITFSPTIVTDEITISITAKANFASVITVTDLNGKVLLRKNEMVITGKNEIKLDLQHLGSGIYICQVSTGRKMAVEKIYKNN